MNNINNLLITYNKYITNEDYIKLLKDKKFFQSIKNLDKDFINSIDNYTTNVEFIYLVKTYYNSNNEYSFYKKIEYRLVCLYKKTKNIDVRNYICIQNINLIKKMASRYSNNEQLFEDLVNEGFIGVIKAIDNFDISKYNNLSKYIPIWIKKSMITYIANNESLIRNPMNIFEDNNKLEKQKENYIKENGTNPSLDVLVNLTKFTHKHIDYIESLNYQFTSLNANLDEEEDELESIIDNKEKTIENIIEDKQKLLKLKRAINQLSYYEKTIIIERYGLYDNKNSTLKQLALKLNTSHQTIATDQKKIVKSLRRILKHY